MKEKIFIISEEQKLRRGGVSVGLIVYKHINTMIVIRSKKCKVVLLPLRIVHFLLIILFFSKILFSQDINIEVKERIVIGDDENAPKEYLFSSPQHVCTDKNDNIYVVDRGMCVIRIFNKTGEYIRSLGKRGKGPGEFQEIICMTIDQKDNLVVVDRMNRRITKFTSGGDKYICYSMLNQSFVDPWFIIPYGKEDYIIHYTERKIYEFLKNPHTETDQILHIFNFDFSLKKQSLIDAGEIWNLDDPFLDTMPGSNSINFCLIDTNKFIISPTFYDGHFYLFEGIKHHWIKKIITGIETKSYELFKKPPDFSKIVNFEDLPVSSFVRSGPGYQYFGRILNFSHGLFFMNPDKIVNIISKYDQRKNKIVYGIEFFNINGKFLGYAKLTNQNVEPDKILSKFRILWKDRHDQFYIRSANEDGFLVLRVITFIYNFKD